MSAFRRHFRNGATIDGVVTDQRAPRVAVVGAGRMGGVHVRALRSLGIVATVVDPDPVATTELAAAGHQTYGVLTALLARPPDAAIVAAPTGHHGAVVAALLDAGVPTLCEKPAGLDAATTRGLAAVSARSGTALAVAYWRRFVPALATIRDDVAAGRFGPLSLIACAQWDHRPPPPAFVAGSGGIAVDMGVHELDQVRWLTGQELTALDWRSSSVRVGSSPGDDPESGALVAVLSGGTIAVVTLGRSYPAGDMCRVELIGPDHAVVEEFLRPVDGDAAFVDAVARQDGAFVDHAVSGARWPGATIADAVAALEAAERVTALIAR